MTPSLLWMTWARRLAITVPGVLLAVTLAYAQATPEVPHAPPTLPVAPPEISADCRTPGLTLSGGAPLPNVINALKTRKVIRIMSIGATYSGGGRGQDYLGLIESALEKLQPGLDVQIIDRGVSGELARDASERLKIEIALAAPDLVIWQVGTNDAMAHIPVDEFTASVRDTIRWLKAHNVDVALVGLHYIRNLKQDASYQATRRALGQIARDEKVLRVGRYEAGQVINQIQSAAGGAPPNEFMLTESGYGCLAEYMVRALSSGLFARKPAPKPRS
jgi:lysophospholipase L1-like esterase